MVRHNKLNKKTIIRASVATLFGLATVGLITGLSVDWSFPSWIYISGSSTMQQFLQSISDIYSPSEVIIDAGGSSVGVDNLINGKKNIASSSKSPSKSTAGIPSYDNNLEVVGKYQQQWQKENIKTVSIAFDAIGIVYKDTGILKGKDVVITPNTILWLYLAFSGYQPVNGLNLTLNSIPNSWELDTSNPENNLVPFARTGGSVQSGTGESFLLDSKLLKEKGNYDAANVLKQYNALSKTPTITNDPLNDESIYSILHSGQYGSYVKTTSESNLQTWQSVKSYSGKGIPITYLSSGFIKSNYQDIINSGYKIAMYWTEENGTNPVSLLNISDNKVTSDNICIGYNWYRPMNLILSGNSAEYIKSFVQWIIGSMLFENSYIMEIYKEQGFIPLDATTIKTMFHPNDQKGRNMIDSIYRYAQSNPDSNYDEYLKSGSSNIYWDDFWTKGSDYSLIQSDQYNIRKSSDIWYGAYKPNN